MKFIKAALLACMLMVFMGADTASTVLSIQVEQSVPHTVSLSWTESNPLPPDWIASTHYTTGQVICPSIGNSGSYEYFAQQGSFWTGISGTVEPTWPQNYTAGQQPPTTGLDGGITDWSMVIQGNSGFTCPSSVISLYYIYRSTVSGGSYSNIGSSTTTNYVDGTVSSGTTYYYVVTALGSNGEESGYSNQATAVIP